MVAGPKRSVKAAPSRRPGGYHVGVFHKKTDRRGRHTYAARWYTPYLGPGRPHRIVIVRNAGQPELTSEAFA